ncbi:hypothetical protein QYM36_017828 [Artemia franciscana]|uniref:YEATS domain-containing protein n=1 Tax=Artemia franciscana TaxID=6661 RepID=A0AA88HEE2_ARTSF|nr:hypothetical protein QYM36_017828 [Artemia franciscana]
MVAIFYANRRDKKKTLAVVIELGHRSTLKNEITPGGLTHDWEVYVQGKDGAPIEKFIEKVVFNLPKDFPIPIRTLNEPPFIIKEAGYGSFRFQIDVHYKNPDKKENSFIYDLLLKPDSNYGHYKQQTLFFVRPSRDWKKTLLQGGAAYGLAELTIPSGFRTVWCV